MDKKPVNVSVLTELNRHGYTIIYRPWCLDPGTIYTEQALTDQ